MDLFEHAGAGWRIRPHTKDDAEAIVGVFCDCLEDFPLRKSRLVQEVERIHYLLGTSTILVAEEESAGVVGFLILQAEAAYVSHLFVHRDWRFCGVGSGLLQVGRVMAGQRLRLDVDVDNMEAIFAYEHLGWKQTVNQGRPGVGQMRLISP